MAVPDHSMSWMSDEIYERRRELYARDGFILRDARAESVAPEYAGRLGACRHD